MRKWLPIVTSIPFALGLGTALAQDRQQAAAPPPEENLIVEQPSDNILSEKLIGMSVHGADDTAVGSLHSLLFNEDDEIVGAVVSAGGFMGIGSKHVALSWDQFDIRSDEGIAHLDLTAEQLQEAPAFKDRETIQSEKEAAEAAKRAEQQRRQRQQQQMPRQQR